MPRFVNHYEVLGVNRDAGPGGIKKAYRRLAERFHPDKVCTLSRDEREFANREMRKINNAKGVLLDVNERVKFDHLLSVMDRQNIPTTTEFAGDVEVTIVTDELDDEDGRGGAGGDDEEPVMVVEEMSDEPGDSPARSRPRRKVRIKMTGGPRGGDDKEMFPMVRFINFYDVLGVERGAERKDIKRAFRKMAEMYHPDKVMNLGEKLKEVADEQMRAINDAKRVLLDADEREAFDNELADRERRGLSTETEMPGQEGGVGGEAAGGSQRTAEGREAGGEAGGGAAAAAGAGGGQGAAGTTTIPRHDQTPAGFAAAHAQTAQQAAAYGTGYHQAGHEQFVPQSVDPRSTADMSEATNYIVWAQGLLGQVDARGLDSSASRMFFDEAAQAFQMRDFSSAKKFAARAGNSAKKILKDAGKSKLMTMKNDILQLREWGASTAEAEDSFHVIRTAYEQEDFNRVDQLIGDVAGIISKLQYGHHKKRLKEIRASILEIKALGVDVMEAQERFKGAKPFMESGDYVRAIQECELAEGQARRKLKELALEELLSFKDILARARSVSVDVGDYANKLDEGLDLLKNDDYEELLLGMRQSSDDLVALMNEQGGARDVRELGTVPDDDDEPAEGEDEDDVEVWDLDTGGDDAPAAGPEGPEDGEPGASEVRMQMRLLSVYRGALKKALSDGVISDDEEAMLVELQETMGMSAEEHYRLEMQIRDEMGLLGGRRDKSGEVEPDEDEPEAEEDEDEPEVDGEMEVDEDEADDGDEQGDEASEEEGGAKGDEDGEPEGEKKKKEEPDEDDSLLDDDFDDDDSLLDDNGTLDDDDDDDILGE